MRREVQLEVVRAGQRLLRTATVDVDGFGDEHFVVAVAPVDDLTSAERQEAEDLAVRAVEERSGGSSMSREDERAFAWSMTGKLCAIVQELEASGMPPEYVARALASHLIGYCDVKGVDSRAAFQRMFNDTRAIKALFEATTKEKQ